MANRLLVATLYSGDTNNFINVSPENLDLTGGDSVFLIVQLGNVSLVQGASCATTLTFPNQDPFVTPPQVLTSNIGSIVSIGTINNVAATDSYTISIVYNGITYSEDPGITIKPI